MAVCRRRLLLGRMLPVLRWHAVLLLRLLALHISSGTGGFDFQAAMEGGWGHSLGSRWLTRGKVVERVHRAHHQYRPSSSLRRAPTAVFFSFVSAIRQNSCMLIEALNGW